MVEREVRLRLNGETRTLRTDPDQPLLWVLRDELRLTGTKYGCGEGECGACTVLVDGTPALSCQVPVGDAGGKEITTIEGLAAENELTPVQRAFAEMGAFQCGYCTPGMVLGATALLRANPQPARDEIVAALDGHLCRCCGYSRILAAVERASVLARSPKDRK